MGESADINPGGACPEERFSKLSKEHSERAKKFITFKLSAALRRRVDSDDVLQEVFLEASRLFLSRQDIASMDGDKFFPWLSKIIEHKIQNLTRFHVSAEKRSIAREVPFEGSFTEHAGREEETPGSGLFQSERLERIRKAMSKLSPREREVVDLVHLQRLKVAVAARRLGKTSNATSVLLHHALVKLGKILKQKEP